MSYYVHNKVRHSRDRPRMSMEFKNQRQVPLFPPIASPEFIVVDIVGALPRTKSGNQYVVITTDQCTEMSRAVPKTNVLSTHVSYISSIIGKFPMAL